MEVDASLIAGLVCMAIWMTPSLAAFHIGSVRVALAPVWNLFIWPILIVTLGGAAGNAFLLTMPGGRHETAVWVRVAFEAAVLGLSCAVLLYGGPWIECGISEIATQANFGVRIGLGVAILFAGIDLKNKIQGHLRRPALS